MGVALGLTLQQRLLKLPDAMEAWSTGMKEVLEPAFILLLAWALGGVIEEVGTATFLAAALQGGLPAWLLPATISLLCYAISFATGSAIGTMAITFPLVGPIAANLGGGSAEYLHRCFGALMGGSLFGNLCPPISDTTILSVLATQCSLPVHGRHAARQADPRLPRARAEAGRVSPRVTQAAIWVCIAVGAETPRWLGNYRGLYTVAR